MTTFKYYIAKRRMYIDFNGAFYTARHDQPTHPIEPISVKELPIPKESIIAESTAATIEEAKSFVLGRLAAIKEQREQDSAVEAVNRELRKGELIAKAELLIANQPIPATVDNIRTIAKYLNMSNWGGWSLPRFTIGYSAHQFDCDGKIATTLTFDTPISDKDNDISNETRFVVGAPRGHLTKYQHI